MGALLAAALTASLFHHRLYYPRGVSDWTYLGALAFPLVFLAAESGPPVGRIGRALASFLQAQGEASYSAYLYHNVFVVLACVLVVELRLEGALREAVVYPFVLTGSFIVSHLSYRAVERPGIALGRRLAVGQGRGRATA